MSGQRFRVVVVDDDERSRRALRALVSGRAELELVAECASAADALRAIRAERPELIFLAARLPDLDGFDLLARAGDAVEGAGVVFVDSDDGFALRAIEVGAVDYLLKPVAAAAFARSVERAAERAAAGVRRPRNGRNGDGAETGVGEGWLRRLLARDGGRIVVVPVDHVVRFEGDGNYVLLHCSEGTYRVRATMTELEGRLDPERFFRIHRSTIVNLEQVRDLTHVIHGDYQVRLADGAEVTLTGARREAFTRVLAGPIASPGTS